MPGSHEKARPRCKPSWYNLIYFTSVNFEHDPGSWYKLSYSQIANLLHSCRRQVFESGR